MKEFKINNEKVLLFQTEGIRIKVGQRKSMSFEQLKAAINKYNQAAWLFGNEEIFDVNTEMLNDAVNIKICDIPVTIETSFGIYNEIVKRFNLDIQEYNELHYNKKKAIKICPV